MTATRLLHVAILLVMGAVWGLQFAMLKLASGGGHAEISLVFYAMLAGAVFFGVVVAIRGAWFPWTGRLVFFLAYIAVLGYVVPMLAVLYTGPHLSAGMITLIASLAPVVAIAIALLKRSEFVSGIRIGAVALGLAASMLVLWPELRLPDHGSLGWLGVAFVIPIMFGYQAVYISAHWPTGLDSLQIAFGEVVVAALCVLPLHLTVGDWIAYDPAWPPAQIGIAVFTVSSLLEAILYFYLVQHAGGVLVSFGSFVSLFAGILWGMTLFGERHDAVFWFAIAVTCGALALLVFDKAEHKKSA